MEKKIQVLYDKWKKEFNHGHNKEFIEEWPENVEEVIGNQDKVIDMYKEIFSHYKLKIRGDILDVGCSMGGFLYSLQKLKSVKFIGGMDLDKTAVQIANEYKKKKKIKNVEIKVSNSSKIPFKDNTFDIVFIKDVVEHLENMVNLDRTLKECYRVLKKGGIMFVEAPNYNYPYEPHLKIPKFPYFSDKKTLKLTSKIFRRDEKFIDQLNFTTPRNLNKSLLKSNFIDIKDIYYDYRINWKLKNIEKSKFNSKSMNFFFKIIKRLKLNFLFANMIRYSKMYPILWFIAKK